MYSYKFLFCTYLQAILRKYLTEEEANNLESYDKNELKAITTFIRTKSGRLIEKVVYITKEEYEAIKRGELDANEVQNI